jgi:hypothetical protein
MDLLLLDMRLNEQISEPEYIFKKCILVNQKAELKCKLEAFEPNRQNRFEPAIAFIKRLKTPLFYSPKEMWKNPLVFGLSD